MTLEEWQMPSRAGAPSPRSVRRPLRSGSPSSGIRSCPRRRRATTRSRVGSTMRSPSRLLRLRSPTCCGWRRRPRTSRRPGDSREAIHDEYPDKMLAYNLSPSFNWDTTGLSDDEMRQFPEELGKLGFVFNFITYGGHQIDGLAAEEFATALRDDGMLALARLQRKFRLLESPYRTPQSLVGGDRLDAALMAVRVGPRRPRRWASGSTQHQHLVQTEVPTRPTRGVACRMGEALGSRREAPRRAAASYRGVGPPGASGAGRVWRCDGRA